MATQKNLIMRGSQKTLPKVLDICCYWTTNQVLCILGGSGQYLYNRHRDVLPMTYFLKIRLICSPLSLHQGTFTIWIYIAFQNFPLSLFFLCNYLTVYLSSSLPIHFSSDLFAGIRCLKIKCSNVHALCAKTWLMHILFAKVDTANCAHSWIPHLWFWLLANIYVGGHLWT